MQLYLSFDRLFINMKVYLLLLCFAISISHGEGNPFLDGYYQRDNPFLDGYVQDTNPFLDGYIQDTNPFMDGYVQDKSVFGFE